MTRPARHEFLSDGSPSCARPQCGLGPKHRVHKAPAQRFVVIVTTYDLQGEDVAVFGDFLDETEANEYAKARRGRNLHPVSCTVLPLTPPA